MCFFIRRTLNWIGHYIQGMAELYHHKQLKLGGIKCLPFTTQMRKILEAFNPHHPGTMYENCSRVHRTRKKHGLNMFSTWWLWRKYRKVHSYNLNNIVQYASEYMRAGKWRRSMDAERIICNKLMSWLILPKLGNPYEETIAERCGECRQITEKSGDQTVPQIW